MNFFRKRNKNKIGNEISAKENSRRNFLSKISASILGVGLVAGATNVFGAKSKTGFIYVKKNGDIIENYIPSGGTEAYIGSIEMVGFNFEPLGWEYCDGQLLSIAAYNSLFTLIGTTYGGNGTTNFAVPDLRGRVPIHFGQGPGLSNYTIGQTGGVENVTLTLPQIPAHTHLISSSSASGNYGTPQNYFPARNADGIASYASSSDVQLNSNSIGTGGSGIEHTNLQPYMAISFVIATEGVYPVSS